jgi:hypothetical protein
VHPYFSGLIFQTVFPWGFGFGFFVEGLVTRFNFLLGAAVLFAAGFFAEDRLAAVFFNRFFYPSACSFLISSWPLFPPQVHTEIIATIIVMSIYVALP